MTSTSHGPWIDLHAHPGRCFLAGYDDTAPMVRLLGPATAGDAVAKAAAAGVCSVSVSTVGDLAVIGPTAGGLGALRPFEPGEAEADHRHQLEGLRSLFDAGVRQVSEASDIEAAHADGAGSAFVCCEGADFLDGRLDGLAAVHAAGARVITLVHYRPNELGDIQTEHPVHGGLSSFGREVVAEMNRLGIVVDLAHATFATTVGALEVSSAPIVISHSHLAGPGADHPRLLTEEHARLVAESGGLVGAWPSGVVAATLADYVDEICRLVDVIGIDHVAIGTDLDANFRPVLTEYDQFADVASMLGERGFDAAGIDQILGGNVLRLFRRVIG